MIANYKKKKLPRPPGNVGRPAHFDKRKAQMSIRINLLCHKFLRAYVPSRGMSLFIEGAVVRSPEFNAWMEKQPQDVSKAFWDQWRAGHTDSE